MQRSPGDSSTVLRIFGQKHQAKRRSRSKRVLTRALPLTVIAIGAVAFGWYEAGAGGRDEHRMVVSYVAAWRRDDYQQMYSMLSVASQQKLSEARFAQDMRRAADTATLTTLHAIKLVSIHGDLARESFALHTRIFGTLRETALIPIAGSGSGARIKYGDSLLLPGVDPGQRLSRVALLGARGTLLASNGQVLAQGSSLDSPIPTVAGEIVGTLGPIPAADREQYVREGYPAKAQVGQDGLEAIFQKQLAGKIGGELVAGKRIIATAAPGLGQTVKTTINPDLEQDAIDAIAGHYAGITVLNPHTGAIEAAAGLAWSALQPPGSTFKIITSAAALGARLTTLNTEYPMSSSVKIDGFTMQNAAGEVCGGTLINAFATSCDTTFAPLGDTIGADRLYKAAVEFGFDQPTGIAGALTSTLPAAGAIGGPIAVGATAIGQGLVQATTLEMADVGATIANGGKRPIPTLAAGAKPKYADATTPAVAGEIQKMMEAVVAYGTGTSAEIPGITVAGKTGTAELASTAGKKNDAKETDAWFVAYAPVPDPKVVVCALFPNAGYGAQTAAPAVRQVLEEALGVS